MQGGQVASSASRGVRDWVAVLFLTAGTGGLVAAGFLWHPLAGLALLSLALICVGVVAGLD